MRGLTLKEIFCCNRDYLVHKPLATNDFSESAFNRSLRPSVPILCAFYFPKRPSLMTFWGSPLLLDFCISLSCGQTL